MTKVLIMADEESVAFGTASSADQRGVTTWRLVVLAVTDELIDNTNLARLRGLGSNEVIVPEMEAFAKGYGFAFRCHARGIRNERSWFHTAPNWDG